MRDIHLDDLLTFLNVLGGVDPDVGATNHTVVGGLHSDDPLSVYSDLCPSYKQWEIDDVGRSPEDLDVLFNDQLTSVYDLDFMAEDIPTILTDTY